jgi:polynucleotide 5'-kinase involved in rRNA processing
MLGALAEAVRAAREAGAERIVIDTTGWTVGPEAVALKAAKAALLGEARVVLIEREDELRAFRRAWRGLERFPLHALRVAPEVRRRSPEERRANREAAFRSHLADAAECEIDLGRVAASGIGALHLPRPSVPTGLLLGLNDPRGRLLSLGILERLDAATGQLRCLCRAEGAAAAEVRFGRLLIDTDGTHTSVADGGGPP